MNLLSSSLQSGLTGGLLIGLSAVIMMLTIGRITGISGIFSSLLKPRSVSAWQVAFIVGLIGTGLVWHHFYQAIPVEINNSPIILIIAGLLVGFGTRLGNGCTSGHGVCGISRFSIRSIIATVVFMAMGMMTVYVARTLIGQ